MPMGRSGQTSENHLGDHGSSLMRGIQVSLLDAMQCDFPVPRDIRRVSESRICQCT